MSYTRPDHDEVKFWADGKSYTRPSSVALPFGYEPSGIISVALACGSPELVTDVGIAGVASVGIACADVQLAGNVGSAGRISVEAAMSSPAIIALAQWASISASIACSEPTFWATSTFDGLIPSNAQLSYLMDIITPSGAVRVPVSSWQSSLQSNAESYVQAVIPACEEWLATLDAGTEFVIYRRAAWGGVVVTGEMSRAPLDTVRTDRGPTNYTATIQGYGPSFPSIDSGAAGFTRQLRDVRMVSSYEGGTRLRTSIDWTLRPGMTATYAGLSFVVSYVNQYVFSGDEYMDVGGDV